MQNKSRENPKTISPFLSHGFHFFVQENQIKNVSILGRAGKGHIFCSFNLQIRIYCHRKTEYFG